MRRIKIWKRREHIGGDARTWPTIQEHHFSARAYARFTANEKDSSASLGMTIQEYRSIVSYLNTTSRHRPFIICGEAATTSLKAGMSG